MWSIPVCSSNIVEALGLSHAIQWVHELQHENVDFELDAKMVVNYYNGGSNEFSDFRAILEDCKRCCNSLLLFF
jgi:ribonuclease HI